MDTTDDGRDMGRPTKFDYYLGIAEAVSKRSTCLRRQYGAVIVQEDEIIATGYNGPPREERNCTDIGECLRQTENVAHGERYELCRSVHAEMNAMLSASRKEMLGAYIYIYGYDIVEGKEISAEPCGICDRMLRNCYLHVARRLTIPTRE